MNNIINILYSSFFIFLINGTLICQSSFLTNPSAEYIFKISVKTKPLKIIVDEDASFNNLRNNIFYQTVATDIGAPSNIFPAIGAEEFTPAKIEISGNPSDNVLVSFQLPSRIYSSDDDFSFIIMSYDNLSGCFLNQVTGSRKFFNPQNGTQLTLPEDGSNAQLQIGGNPFVPLSALPGEYIGEAIITVSYTGGS